MGRLFAMWKVSQINFNNNFLSSNVTKSLSTTAMLKTSRKIKNKRHKHPPTCSAFFLPPLLESRPNKIVLFHTGNKKRGKNEMMMMMIQIKNPFSASPPTVFAFGIIHEAPSYEAIEHKCFRKSWGNWAIKWKSWKIIRQSANTQNEILINDMETRQVTHSETWS